MRISDWSSDVCSSDLAWVGFMVNGDGESLLLTIRDHGGGFAPEMLMQIGKPYQSSKGRPGGGLGLFLVVNVVRKFGGRVSARNHPDGSAEEIGRAHV